MLAALKWPSGELRAAASVKNASAVVRLRARPCPWKCMVPSALYAGPTSPRIACSNNSAAAVVFASVPAPSHTHNLRSVR